MEEKLKLFEDSDLICDDCGVKNKDVKECYCPYTEELTGRLVDATLCKHCYNERLADV